MNKENMDNIMQYPGRYALHVLKRQLYLINRKGLYSSEKSSIKSDDLYGRQAVSLYFWHVCECFIGGC